MVYSCKNLAYIFPMFCNLVLGLFKGDELIKLLEEISR